MFWIKWCGKIPKENNWNGQLSITIKNIKNKQFYFIHIEYHSASNLTGLHHICLLPIRFFYSQFFFFLFTIILKLVIIIWQCASWATKTCYIVVLMKKKNASAFVSSSQYDLCCPIKYFSTWIFICGIFRWKQKFQFFFLIFKKNVFFFQKIFPNLGPRDFDVIY